eukprot:3460349-Prymnesium_polylepis.1
MYVCVNGLRDGAREHGTRAGRANEKRVPHNGRVCCTVMTEMWVYDASGEGMEMEGEAAPCTGQMYIIVTLDRIVGCSGRPAAVAAPGLAAGTPGTGLGTFRPLARR